MAENVRIVNVEDMLQAARNMDGAAEEMKRAAQWFDETLRHNQKHMDEWLDRFNATVESMKPKRFYVQKVLSDKGRRWGHKEEVMERFHTRDEAKNSRWFNPVIHSDLYHYKIEELPL